MARIDNLKNYLTDVAKAIKDKKNDQTPIKASEFDNEITNLPSGTLDFEITDGRSLFIQNARIELKDIFLPRIKKLTNMTSMFSGCSKLTDLDISYIDTSNITNMENVFSSCSNLKTLKRI